MRKDVRMGFAVGGVLLAVLVVAILFFHHNKNAGQAVAFDSGGKPAIAPGGDQPSADSTSAATDSAQSTTATPTPAPAAAPAANVPADSKTPADETNAPKGGNQWDALFASTAEDPIRARLTSETLDKQKNKSRKHRTDAATAMDSSIQHDASAIPAVANTPLNTNSTPVSQTIAPAHSVSASRLAASSSKDSSRTHVVATGETFVSIARAVYGDGRYYQSLIDANPNVDPDKLKPGMTIQLPPDSQVKESRGKSSSKSSGSAAASDGKTYTVQNGDSLYKIAKKLYGNGQKSDDLYEANKQLIGPDSTRLKVGMVLKLPEAPTVQ